MLSTICDFLDDFLEIREIEDYPNAINGLQLENNGRVTRIGAAVDASEATIDATETFGVHALAARAAAEFELPWCFLDHPSGL
jgi:putative NIF3 family GTP cyclohydrolase 1 type 2